MSHPALLSCLGVEGWGALHLLLPGRGEPPALQERLMQAWLLAARSTAAEPRPAHLLACLLRSQQDLLPVPAPLLFLPSPGLIHFRHRLVCCRGERWLRLRSWECRSSPSPASRCGEEWRWPPDRPIWRPLPLDPPEPHPFPPARRRLPTASAAVPEPQPVLNPPQCGQRAAISPRVVAGAAGLDRLRLVPFRGGSRLLAPGLPAPWSE